MVVLALMLIPNGTVVHAQSCGGGGGGCGPDTPYTYYYYIDDPDYWNCQDLIEEVDYYICNITYDYSVYDLVERDCLD